MSPRGRGVSPDEQQVLAPRSLLISLVPGALPLPAAGDAVQGGAAAPARLGAARRAAGAPAPPRKQHFLAQVLNVIIR